MQGRTQKGEKRNNVLFLWGVDHPLCPERTQLSQVPVVYSLPSTQPLSFPLIDLYEKSKVGAMPPALWWPHTSRLVWAHIKCFSHPPRPLKVNNPQRMRHLLRRHPIPHTWQVSVYTHSRAGVQGGREAQGNGDVNCYRERKRIRIHVQIYSGFTHCFSYTVGRGPKGFCPPGPWSNHPKHCSLTWNNVWLDNTDKVTHPCFT